MELQVRAGEMSENTRGAKRGDDVTRLAPSISGHDRLLLPFLFRQSIAYPKLEEIGIRSPLGIAGLTRPNHEFQAVPHIAK